MVETSCRVKVSHFPIFASKLSTYPDGRLGVYLWLVSRHATIHTAWPTMLRLWIRFPEWREMCGGQPAQLPERLKAEERCPSNDAKDNNGGDQAREVGIDIAMCQVRHRGKRLVRRWRQLLHSV